LNHLSGRHDSPDFQLRAPGLTANIDGKNKTLYLQHPAALEKATRKNLDLTLSGKRNPDPQPDPRAVPGREGVEGAPHT
jgi:hypothetical protein